MSDWLDEERRAPGLLGEAARLWRRARARPVRVLLPAVLFALAGIALRWQPSYTALIVLRLAEVDLDAPTAPAPVRDLLEHVVRVPFSDGRLLDLIRAERLYPRQLARGERVALEAIRDDIEVEVRRNEFLEPPDPERPARSARVELRYRCDDPARARRVVEALAGLVVEEQQARRLAASEVVARAAETAHDAARAQLLRRKTAAARLAIAQFEAAGDPLYAVYLASEMRSIGAAEDDLEREERQVIALARRRALERSRAGMRIDVVDEEPPRPREPRAWSLSVLGLSMFLLGVPLSAIAVGAFDPYVRDAEDVRRLGLAVLGAVPRGPGPSPPARDPRRPTPTGEGRPARPGGHAA